MSVPPSFDVGRMDFALMTNGFDNSVAFLPSTVRTELLPSTARTELLLSTVRTELSLPLV